MYILSQVYRTGLDSFPSEVTLLVKDLDFSSCLPLFKVGVARVQEALGNLALSAK